MLISLLQIITVNAVTSDWLNVHRSTTLGPLFDMENEHINVNQFCLIHTQIFKTTKMTAWGQYRTSSDCRTVISRIHCSWNISTEHVHKVSFPGANYRNKTQFNGKIYTVEPTVYPCVVELCRLGMKPLCDIHLCLSIILKMLILNRQEFLEMQEKIKIPGHKVQAIEWMVKHLPAELCVDSRAVCGQALLCNNILWH